MIIAVGDFAKLEATQPSLTPLTYYVSHSDSSYALKGFASAASTVEMFSKTVAPYPYEKLALIIGATQFGGMENSSAIVFTQTLFSIKAESKLSRAFGIPTNIESTVAHEIAHQWFGDSVTESDWDDVWLSEGFATYFALLFTEHDEGRDAFVDGLKRSRVQVLQLTQKMPDTPVIHRNLSDMTKVLNNLVYQKGGWTLHMLRNEVGTENFWTAIREYYRRYRNTNTSTAELRAIFEQVSGKNLEWFFTQWLTRPGVPKIEGSWSYDAIKKVVAVTVTQSQAAPAYRVKLDVSVAAKAGDPPRVETIDMNAKQGVYTFAADAAPASVTLDPNTTLLMDAGPFVRR
jgi:aminopeptidase N